MYQSMRNYPAGSVVQRRNGYILVKIQKGKWESQARLNAMKMLGRELQAGERVYHKDGNRENNKPANLAVIRFNTVRYVFLKRARPLFIPSKR